MHITSVRIFAVMSPASHADRSRLVQATYKTVMDTFQFPKRTQQHIHEGCRVIVGVWFLGVPDNYERAFSVSPKYDF